MMSKFFHTALLLVIIGSVLSKSYKITQPGEELGPLRPRPDILDEPQDVKIDGRDGAQETNQGFIATYWNNFLKRARLPLPSWNITNPLSNLFTPYVVEVDYPQESSQSHQQTGHLILLDPQTQQYYKVQPVSS